MKNGRVSALAVEDMTHFLEKQHQQRDAYYEEVATLIVESVGHSDKLLEINQIIEHDVSQVVMALGK